MQRASRVSLATGRRRKWSDVALQVRRCVDLGSSGVSGGCCRVLLPSVPVELLGGSALVPLPPPAPR